MEKSNQNVGILVGKLVADMLMRMNTSLHQRVKVQKKLLKQPKHEEIFRTMQNDKERNEFLKKPILGGYDD